MKTTELKKLMPTNKADIQGHGIIEFYTPEQVVEILRLLGVVGQSEQLPNLHCGYDRNKCVKQSACKYPNCDT